eukprot:scaffold23151_cov117-Isochrysis_galbana.AAC.7
MLARLRHDVLQLLVVFPLLKFPFGHGGTLKLLQPYQQLRLDPGHFGPVLLLTLGRPQLHPLDLLRSLLQPGKRVLLGPLELGHRRLVPLNLVRRLPLQLLLEAVDGVCGCGLGQPQLHDVVGRVGHDAHLGLPQPVLVAAFQYAHLAPELVLHLELLDFMVGLLPVPLNLGFVQSQLGRLEHVARLAKDHHMWRALRVPRARPFHHEDAPIRAGGDDVPVGGTRDDVRDGRGVRNGVCSDFKRGAPSKLDPAIRHAQDGAAADGGQRLDAARRLLQALDSRHLAVIGDRHGAVAPHHGRAHLGQDAHIPSGRLDLVLRERPSAAEATPLGAHELRAAGGHLARRRLRCGE